MLRWARELSLSHKLPLLVGLAVTAIVIVALTPAWLRMRALVEAGQLETSRELLEAWASLPQTEGKTPPDSIGDARVRVLTEARARSLAEGGDGQLAAALRTLDGSGWERAAFVDEWEGLARRMLYAAPEADRDGVRTLITLERTSENAAALVAVNSIYLFAAGSTVLGVALVAFYLITWRLVLRPLRSLRLWADAVRDGNLDERSAVDTGDEFQQLAETCNLMLDELQDQQRRLRAINLSLDVKLNELAEANEALDRASRLKGEFIGNMSHELRTPLNSIIGFGDLLLGFAHADAQAAAESDNPPATIERRKRYLENIVTAARGLLDLIEDLLELARLEAGRVDLRVEALDLVELVRGAVALVQPTADALGATIGFDAPPHALRTETDQRKLQQIVLNLLSNAVRFAGTEDDPGRVFVRVSAEGEKRRISVTDNGPGIPPEEQERVFRKFEQLDGGETRTSGGAGLGLSISRELATLLQGEIQLASATGRGSTFSLVIPARIDSARSEEHRLESRFRGVLARS